MSHFNVTADFNLIKKPYWIKEFRKKYDKPYPSHVTLKTPTSLDKKDIDNIKKELKKIVKQFKPIEIVFNKLKINESAPGGGCIMIMALKNLQLSKLQKIISKRLVGFGEHIDLRYKIYEQDFKPHITIARKLTKTQLKSAIKDLQNNIACKAIISKITFAIVDDISFNSWLNSKSKKTYFKLK